ncbi:Neuronal acetylcholine receptor subunit alpha-3 [Cichlidogyrus casuarinus]|uniref:Neuronal acetylcholine receptor subunit alpha-3 n=1 Tax=Cichlidogyrus casuarinus TaxID=1844966 RepID=A0ABD2PV26_9PLAT
MAVRYSTKYDCCTFYFEDIKVFITLQRRSLYYIFNLIIPCMIITVMALMVFTLPPDAGEKISLGVTTLLSLTMFLQMVADKLPQTSESIPLIGVYFSCIMILCSLSIVFTVLVLKCHHMSPSEKPPRWLSVYVNYYIAKLIGIEPLRRREVEEVEIHSNSDSTLNVSSTSDESVLAAENGYNNLRPSDAKKSRRYFQDSVEKKMVNVLDLEDDFRISSLKQMEKNSEDSESEQSSSSKQIADDSGLVDGARKSLVGTKTVDGAMCSYRPDLSKLIEQLQVITDHIHAEDEDSACANEWKFGAKVIDKFCLIVFGLSTLVITLGILCSARNFADSFSAQYPYGKEEEKKFTLDDYRELDFTNFKLSNGYNLPFNLDHALKDWKNVDRA